MLFLVFHAVSAIRACMGCVWSLQAVDLLAVAHHVEEVNNFRTSIACSCVLVPVISM